MYVIASIACGSYVYSSSNIHSNMHIQVPISFFVPYFTHVTAMHIAVPACCTYWMVCISVMRYCSCTSTCMCIRAIFLWYRYADYVLVVHS